MTWLLRGGDDPSYARPDLDDSQWIKFDPRSPVTTIFPGIKPEVIWYRLHVKVDASQTGLALKEQSIGRAFEVYVNGERLIGVGHVSPYRPHTVGARILRRIPQEQISTGSLIVAVRVHIAAGEWRNSSDAGYYATNLTLGQERTLYRDDWLALLGGNFFAWLDLILLVGLGDVALVLYRGQPTQREYLWVFALGMVRLVEFVYEVTTQVHDIPVVWQYLWGCFTTVTPALWVTIYLMFVGKRVSRRFMAYLLVAGLFNAYSNLQALLPMPPGNWALTINLPFVSLLAIYIPIVLIVNFRRGNREAGILLVPALLFCVFIYVRYSLALLFQIPAWRVFALKGFDLINNYQLGPFSISLDTLSGISSTIALVIIILLRATRLSRRQALLEGELEAAQQVQQLLVPERTPAIPGYTVESVYQPAQQVGGDFVQVLPVDGDGLLLVVGDVAGKGLPAAMLVSLLVGAIRTAVEETAAPGELLRKLNERLVGRSRGGFSTALAAYFAADGKVTIANAGHLSPYLDGREVELPGALPLGIVAGTRYETKTVAMLPGSRLTFYSDGVVEAQNGKGELFGFERGQLLSTRPAEEIVKAAEEFGQSDDITVVSVTRAPVEVDALDETLSAMQPA